MRVPMASIRFSDKEYRCCDYDHGITFQRVARLGILQCSEEQ